jgi:hypothetical protein
MGSHPVRLAIAPGPPLRQRSHVVVRLALLIALVALGFTSLWWALYLALPAGAALIASQKGGARYLAEDAPAIVRALGWVAATAAYLALLTDAFPTRDAASPVSLEVETGGAPTTASALLRLLYSVPALLVAALLACAASLAWLFGALAILVGRRLPVAVADFLELTLRYELRLAAYHLSLVERYPSFEEAPLAHPA